MASNFRPIPAEIKETILKQVKNDGRSVSEVSKEFSVSTVTIYKWLSTEVSGTGKTDIAYLKEINKLKKEKEDLLRIVGAFSVVVERLKKKDAEDRCSPKSRKRG
jgi:transposase-like protein